MNSYGKNMNDRFDTPALRGMRSFHVVIMAVVAAAFAVAAVAAAFAPSMATTPPVIS